MNSNIREIQDDDSSFYKKSTLLIFAYIFEIIFNSALLGMAIATVNVPTNICNSFNNIATTNSYYNPTKATAISNQTCSIYGFYWLYVWIVLNPLVLRSVFRFVIIMKKLREIKKKMGLIPVEYDQNGNIKEPWHNQGVGPLLILFFYIIKWLYFLIKLFDLRECFWRYQNYLVRSILGYLFQACITIFCLVVNIWMITLSSDADSKNLQGACISFISARFISITIYFVTCELYVPSKIKEIQIQLDQQAECQVQTISNEIIDDRTEKLPKDDKKNNKKCFSLLKKKYRPVPQFGRFMRLWEVGTEGCILNDQCLSVNLEHILKCHDDLNIPTRRCNCNYCCGRDNYMIGFHQTSEISALKIALSPFKIGTGGGTFGNAIYFARSINHTIGKAIDAENGRARWYMGPVICAILDMGRIMYTHDLTRRDTTLESLNAMGYDSIYAYRDGRPELIIYEPKRIVKFIVCYKDKGV